MYPFFILFGREISTYGVCMVVGISVVYLLALTRKQGVSFYDLLIIGATALLFGLPCGSAVYAVVTFGFRGVLENIKNGNFQVFNGLVFYGSLVGGVFGSLLGIRLAKAKILSVEKTVVPFIPIGHAIGRIGCVMAGCCYGMEYDGIFAIYYPNAVTGVSQSQGHFPVQLLEGIMNILISLLLLKIANRCTRKFQLLSVYLILYGAVRFAVEFLRGDAVRGVYFTLSTSQWISILLSVIGLLYLIFSVFRKNQ